MAKIELISEKHSIDNNRNVSRAFVLEDSTVIDVSVLDYYRVTKKDDRRTKDNIETVYKFLSGSKQIRDRFQYSKDQVILPPYDMVALNKLQELNTYHASAIRVKAWDTVGRGWSFEPIDQDKPTPDRSQLSKIEQLFNNPGEIALNQLFHRAMIDFYSVGMGALEVIRTGKEITAFTHLPAHTLRIHQDGNKYLQRRGISHKWFKRFGYEKDIDADKGNENTLGSLDEAVRANELIVWTNYCPWDDYYGMPEYLPIVPTIWVDKLREEYNIDFFENYAVPAYAISVVGTSIDSDMENVIKDYFQRKLRKNRHSTLILQVQKKANDLSKDPITVKFEPLSVDVKEASFRLLRQDNVGEILTAHRVPAYRLGVLIVGALGQNVAEETTEIYKDNVIEPIQQMLEDMFNMLIVQKEFGVANWVFRFNDIDLSDEILELDKDIKLFTNAARTPNDLIRVWGGKVSTDPAMDNYYVNGTPITGDLAQARGSFSQEEFIKRALEMQREIKDVITKSTKGGI